MQVQRVRYELELAPASPLTTAADAAATLGMATAGPVGEQLAAIEKTIGIETTEGAPLSMPHPANPDPDLNGVATSQRARRADSPQSTFAPAGLCDPDCGWGVTAPQPFGVGNKLPFRCQCPDIAVASSVGAAVSPNPGPVSGPSQRVNTALEPRCVTAPPSPPVTPPDTASQASSNPDEPMPYSDEAVATLARAWATRRYYRPPRVIYASLSFSNAYVANAIVSHPALGNAVKRVLEEGGEIQPVWSNGGLMLHPYDTEDIERGPPLNMEATHIILSEDDLGALGTALLGIPKEYRPGIFFEGATSMADALLDSDSDTGDGAPKIPEEDLLRNRLGGICQGCGTRGLAGQCEFCGAPTTNNIWHFNSDGWLRTQVC